MECTVSITQNTKGWTDGDNVYRVDITGIPSL